jgi:membrane protease YdiL (CAAX protease family)
MARTPEIPPPPGPSPFARGPTGMSGAVTVVLGLMLLGLLFAASLAMPGLDRAVAFDRAPESVTRIYERQLEMAAALRELPPWESAALGPFLPAETRSRDEAIAAFRAVVEAGQVARDDEDGARESEDAAAKAARAQRLDGLRARRAALLAEHGRLEEAQADLDELQRHGHADFVVAVRALYGGKPNPDHLALLGDGWIGRVALAQARREAPPLPGAEAHRALKWAHALTTFVAAGLVVLLAWLARNRPDVAASSILVPSVWSPQTGFGALVRAASIAIVVLVAFPLLAGATGSDVPLVCQTAVASIPRFLLAQKHLARPHRMELLDLVGFPATRSVVLLSALALLAVDRIGGEALATAARAAGAAEPWTQQYPVFHLWSSDAVFVFGKVDVLVFGVLARELAFRGILFPSLRHVHGPLHAALLTGMLSSAVHMASFPAMLALAWSGFVAAIAVERTRSLLPVLIAAGIGGLIDAGLFAALYR